MKWSLWVVHRLVLTAVYGFILFMYLSKQRERLPGKFAKFMHVSTRIFLSIFMPFVMTLCLSPSFAARPAFYKYIVIMFILNALALFACGLTVNGTGFGFW